jgi:WD40 repeat protein/serine/threonine protein kinase
MSVDSAERFNPDSSGEDKSTSLASHELSASELTETSARIKPDTRLTELSSSPAASEEAGSAVPRRSLGDFDLIREIGRGGMGVVHEARHRSLGKRVAVKVLPPAATMDKRAVKRFQNEAWAAAQLQHRNIVSVYHVGSEDGVYFYAMQFIEGVDLGDLYQSLKRAAKHQGPENRLPFDSPPDLLFNRFKRFMHRSHTEPPARPASCDTRKANPSALKRDSTHRSDHSKKETLASPRLIEFLDENCSTAGPRFLAALANMGIQVADALQYAHDMGIVHRDIKPSNLLLDLDGDVWVSDFGLAQIENHQGLSITGAMVGTLRYMSPEQLLGKRVGVDHRTDIYSLGVTLYELLTLRHAFSGDSREAIMRKITFDDPTLPRKIDRRIPVELETVVMKAMSKNPVERYQTAAEMADDLRRFRNHEPIKGRKATVPQRLGRWARRNRSFVASVGYLMLITFIAAVALAGISWNLYTVTAVALQSEQEQKAEVQRLYRRSEGLRFAANSALELNEDPTRALLLAIEGAKRFPGSDTNGAILDALDANHEWQMLTGHAGPVGDLAFNFDGSKLVSTAPRSRFDQGDTAMIWDTASGRLVGQLTDSKAITSAVFSPDRFRILAASSPLPAQAIDDTDGALVGLSPSLWDAVNVNKLLSFKDAFLFEAHSSAFDSDGRRAVFPSLGHSATIYDCVAGHELVRLAGHDKRVVFAAFSPQGDRVVTASDDNTVRVWDANSGEPIYQFDLWRQRDPKNNQCLVDSVSFQPDGRQLVTGSSAFGIHLWDLSTGERINQQHLKGGRAVYWPTSPQLLTYVPYGRELTILNASSGNTFRTLKPDDGAVRQAEISPDGQWIAMQAHSDTTLVSIWNAASGEVETVLKGHRFIVNDIAFSPDSKLIATASSDNTVRLWYLANGRDRLTYPTRAWTNNPLAVASPDGKQVAVVARDAATVGHIVDFAQPAQSMEVTSRIWMPSGTSTRFVAANKNRLAIHAVSDGKEQNWITSPNGSFQEAAINRGGDRVAAATSAHSLILWFPDENRQVVLADNTAPVFALRFTPDGDRLASASADGFVRLWDAKTGKSLAELQCDAVVLDVVFHPDSTRLAAATDQDRAVIWDLESFQKLQTLQSPGARFNHVEFSFDGRQLVSYHSSNSDAAHLWNAESGTIESKLDVTGLVHVAMHPNQNETLVTSTNQGAMIWKYNQNLRQPITDEPMECGRFTADGSELVIGSAVSLPDQPWQLAEAPKKVAPPVLQRWRCDDLVRLNSVELSSERIFELFLSRDGLALLNANRLAGVVNYDAVTHEPISRIPGHPAQISACLFTSDSSRLITASWDQKISIWNASDGRHLKSLIGHQSAVNSLAISGDDRLLASGADDGQCILWDLQTGELKQQFKPVESSIQSIELNPAGDQFLAITSDHSLHLYDVRENKQVDLNLGASQIAWAEYSPDGSSLLVIPHVPENPDAKNQPAKQPTENAGYAVLIVPVNGNAITSIAHDAPIVTAHFHRCGQQIISATREGIVTLRDVATGKVQLRLPHPGTNVTAAVLSKSGQYAAVAGQDRVTIWKVERGLQWLSVPSMGAVPESVHRYNPFVPQAKLLLTQRIDSFEFRSSPIEPLEFAESRPPDLSETRRRLGS